MGMDDVSDLLSIAVAAGQGPEREVVDYVVAQLCALDPSTVRREAERQARLLVASAWRHGWQPIEVARQVRRNANGATTGLSLTAIAADHANRAASTLDPRWVAQLDDLELPAVAGTGWLAEWGRAVQLTWPEQIRSVVSLLATLASLSPIAILIPPPGARNAPDPIIDLTARGNDPVLDRIRALLAQAESTTFDAEAEAFTAKAQELMTRHAIDAAMVSASALRSEQPGTIRLPVDDPYCDAKSLLLQFVAESSRCRAVFYPRVICPFTGNTALEWRIASGLGTVYATTVTHPAQGEPYNVALID